MRVRALVVLIFSGAVLSAACSSSSDASQPDASPKVVASDSSSPSDDPPSTSETTADPEARWPFTGLPAPQGLPERRTMIVKVDNTPGAEPQVGLSSADLVIEELVEGGFTRYAAFYYSALPETVGPVRSIRTSDIGFVRPVDALLVASGGAPQPLRQLQAAGIDTGFQETLPGFYRASDRPSPYNLFLHPRQAATSLASTEAPTDYLPWATDDQPSPAGQPVTAISAVFSPAHTSTWQYQQDAGWLRTNGLEAPGDRFTPKNVIVLEVRIEEAPYVDFSGAPVPETILVGSGRAVVISENQAVTGRWEKKSTADELHLVDQKGDPLSVPPGKTCIELVPLTGSVQLTR